MGRGWPSRLPGTSAGIDNSAQVQKNRAQLLQPGLIDAWQQITLPAPKDVMARILCIDDEPHVVTLKCAILEAAGHTVTPSSSAHDAIEKLKSNEYDAVVTDWRLGDANGRAVVQAAKSHSSMPVVVVSGYVAEAFQAAEPLADLYLEKPVNPEELVTIVNELLKTSERSA